MSSSSVTEPQHQGNPSSQATSSDEFGNFPEPFASHFRSLKAALQRREDCKDDYFNAQIEHASEQKDSDEDEKKQRIMRWNYDLKLQGLNYLRFEVEEEILKYQRAVWEAILNPSNVNIVKELVPVPFPWVALYTDFGSSLYDLIKASNNFSSVTVMKAVEEYALEFHRQQENVKQQKEEMEDLGKRIKAHLHAISV